MQIRIDFNESYELKYDIDLSDKSLFGADDAAHEDFNLLKSYSFERLDCEEYLNESNSFMILKAPKGTGKTTLIRLWQNNLAKKTNYISLLKFDSQISPELENASLSQWIRSWKLNIVYSIFLSITNNKTYGIKPDKFKFIESVERRGDRRQNLIDLVIEHLPKGKLLDIKELQLKKDYNIWVFLDEIDQYFTRSEHDIMKMSSMLIACREMTSYISKLSFRTTIKPNVWAILKSNVPSMSNINELVINYEWNFQKIKSVLAMRIRSYIIRKYYTKEYNKKFPFYRLPSDEDWYINQLFDPKTDFDLSAKKAVKRDSQVILPHKTVALLGNFKPRWIISLCKQSAYRASKSGSKINIKHIKHCLPEYGRERIIDIASEYKAQCINIRDVMYAFYQENSNYSNFQYLLEKINTNILSKFKVQIEGVSENCDASQIAKFLFELGFIQPKNWYSKQRFEFLPFEQNPFLLEGNNNSEKLNEELIWEIHPLYRNVLNLDRTPHSKLFKNK